MTSPPRTDGSRRRLLAWALLALGLLAAAAAFRASTQDLETRFGGARQLFAGNVAGLDNYQFVFGRGAVPLVQEGRIIGAVGVSGAVPAENDHLIAETAAWQPVVPRSH